MEQLITKDTVIGKVLQLAPDAAPVLLSVGMHCLGCPSAQRETVGEACSVHGVDVERVLDQLNALAAKRG